MHLKLDRLELGQVKNADALLSVGSQFDFVQVSSNLVLPDDMHPSNHPVHASKVASSTASTILRTASDHSLVLLCPVEFQSSQLYLQQKHHEFCVQSKLPARPKSDHFNLEKNGLIVVSNLAPLYEPFTPNSILLNGKYWYSRIKKSETLSTELISSVATLVKAKHNLYTYQNTTARNPRTFNGNKFDNLRVVQGRTLQQTMRIASVILGVHDNIDAL